MAALLAACAAALALAADPAPGPAPSYITPEESARIDAEHARLCAELPPLLDAVALQRKGYGGAPDPNAHLARWGALLAPAHRLAGEEESLRKVHDDRTRALEAFLLKNADGHTSLGDTDSRRASLDFTGIRAANNAIQIRKSRALARYFEERVQFQEAARARAAAGAEGPPDRPTTAALVFGAAAVLALAGWAVWRAVPRTPAAVAAPDPRAVPALIGGNIAVVRPLGRGGMGEVYEGLDRTLQRRVALKRLRPELTGSPADLYRLLNEARLVAALKHPNVVAIHSVEKEAGQVFLVLEYVDGPTLATLLSQRRQFRWPEALRVFSGAAAALQAAHGRGIVHRDLKPGNIMLDSKGVVKVLDFGIAHEAARAVSRLTRSGAWGTPPYMSPEQELGEVNAGADLFALNVVLYEMLTGELPFTGPNFLAQKREGVYIPVTRAVPALPKAVDRFFAAAFCPDPAGRFSDAATLAAAAGALA